MTDAARDTGKKMKKLISILKSKAVIIFLAALTTVIGFLYFWGKISPKEKPAQLPDFPSLTSPNIEQHSIIIKPQISSLKGKFAAFPKELPVYRINPPIISPNQTIDLAYFLGFSQEPKISENPELGPIYRWKTKESGLTVLVERGTIRYTLDLLNNPGLLTGTPPPLEEVKTTVLNFIQNQAIPLPENLKPEISQTDYLKESGPIFVPSDSSSAEFIKITFDFEIEGKKLLMPIPNTPPLNLIVGPEMRIVRLDYQYPFSQYESFHSYPLKTEEEVLDTIEKTLQLTSLQIPGDYELTPSDYQSIRSVDLSNVELGYYLSLPPESYLQPVFLIHGTFQLLDERTGDAYLYLPAITEEYLTTPEP